jgi:putative ABC transport system permease protein
VLFNEFLGIVDTMGMALRILLGFVGTLTLAMGDVGLANIMLVSVTQRTREIGTLKSIGATSRSILFLFLLEAMTIVTVGGILGVACGYCVTAALQMLRLPGPLFQGHQRNL